MQVGELSRYTAGGISHIRVYRLGWHLQARSTKRMIGSIYIHVIPTSNLPGAQGRPNLQIKTRSTTQSHSNSKGTHHDSAGAVVRSSRVGVDQLLDRPLPPGACAGGRGASTSGGAAAGGAASGRRCRAGGGGGIADRPPRGAGGRHDAVSLVEPAGRKASD